MTVPLVVTSQSDEYRHQIIYIASIYAFDVREYVSPNHLNRKRVWKKNTLESSQENRHDKYH